MKISILLSIFLFCNLHIYSSPSNSSLEYADYNINVSGLWRLSGAEDFIMNVALQQEESGFISGEVLHFWLGVDEQCRSGKITGFTSGRTLTLNFSFSENCCEETQYTLSAETSSEVLFYGTLTMSGRTPIECDSRIIKKVNNFSISGEKKVESEVPLISGSDLNNSDNQTESNSLNFNSNGSIEKPIAEEEFPFNHDFTSLEGWTVTGGKTRINEGILGIKPNKKKNPVVMVSNPFILPSGRRSSSNTSFQGITVSINTQWIPRGDITFSLINEESNAKIDLHLVQKREIALAPEDGKELLSDPLDTPRSIRFTQSEVANVQAFIGKRVRIEVVYEAKGVNIYGIPFLYIDYIDINARGRF